MGTAMLAGQKFRLNPESVGWGYKSKISDTNTVGGRVVQIFGTAISDLTVTGSFGKGGWKDQQAFLERMKALADTQIHQASVRNSTAASQRFIYPDYGWDFQVMLRSFSSPDGQRSVNLSNDIIAPKWTLTLFIVGDRSSLKKVSSDAYLARLSKGLGWKQTEYNGPLTNEEMIASLSGQSVADSINSAFGLGSIPTGNQDSADPSGNGTAPPVGTGNNADTGGQTGGTPDQNRALGKALAASVQGWTGPQWDALLKIWNAESGWSTTADNPTSSAYGIPQALPGSKMSGSGDDWKTNPKTQILWGLGYIFERYGDPVKAWAFHLAHGWY